MVNMQISTSLPLETLKKGTSKIAIVTSMLLVAGCSTPDWVNPGNWFEGEGDAARPEQIEQPETEYPKLGDVPEEAGKTVSIQEAKTIEEGLKADRQNAEYTDEKLRADTAQQVAPRPPAPASQSVAPVQPATAATVQPGPAVTAAPSPQVNSAEIAKPVPVPAPATVSPIARSTAPGQPGVKLMPDGAPVTSQTQAYAQIAPGTGTTVISGTGVNSVYQQQLNASAATTTTLPANTQFQSYPVRPLNTNAVAVPKVVRDAYNQPVAVGYGNAVQGRTGAPAYGSQAANVKPDAVIYFETGSSRIG
ncbi:MAG: hypothetical protein MI743_13520, partial [Sneathiellales bacterium]|nr:hypothetical protein [Sneathiellales bacterium]